MTREQIAVWVACWEVLARYAKRVRRVQRGGEMQRIADLAVREMQAVYSKFERTMPDVSGQ